jgi:hypothetical protein
LNHRMLFRDAGVLQRQIRDVLVATCKPAATLIQLYRIEEVFLLEDIHPPLLLGGRFACFSWLVVLEDTGGARDGVCFFG